MAMVLFIVAVGLCLIFGTLKVLNFAHGSFFMLGAYFCLTITSVLAGNPANFWIALILAPVLVGLVGGVAEVLLFRRMYRTEHIFQLILSFALILVFSDIVRLTWGWRVHPISTPWPLQGSVLILDRMFPLYNLILIIVGPVMLYAVWTLLHKTGLGRNIRAITYSREMASALGHNVPLIYTVVFMVGCALGGMGGVLAAPLLGANPGMDTAVIIDLFVIIVWEHLSSGS
jgi:branched-chain amino acid transport system permease protein